MTAKLTMPLAFLAFFGCAHSQAVPPSASSAPPETSDAAAPATATAEEPAASPGETLSEANRLYDSQWGATRGGQFEVDRQVVELQRAVHLYHQFIERAGGQPDLQVAVRKSRERVVDACQTIEFLLGSSPEGKPLATPGC